MSPTPKPTAVPPGKKMVKVTPGSQIKDMSTILRANAKIASQIIQSRADSKAAIALRNVTPSKPQASAKKVNNVNAGAPASGDRTTAAKPNLKDSNDNKTSPKHTTPPSSKKATEQQGDDLDIFSTDSSPFAKVKEKSFHEQSVRHLQALKLPTSGLDLQPKIMHITPAKKDDAIDGRQLLVPSFEQRLSLQRMKDDAQSTLQERRTSLIGAYNRIATVNHAAMSDDIKDLLRTTMEVLRAQIQAVDDDIHKLKLFGRGFKTYKIKGIDTKAIIALSSWGIAVEKHFESDGVAAQNLAPVNDAALKATPEPAPDAVPAGEDAFGDTEIEGLLSPANTRNQTVPSQESQNAELFGPPSRKPSPKPRPNCRLFIKRKPKHLNSMIAHTPQHIQTGFGQSLKVNIMDDEVAIQVEAIGEGIEKHQKSKANNRACFVTKGAGERKGRFGMDAGGNMIFRKKKCTNDTGEKRKRGDVMEQPNKRSAIEGRNFAPLRTRRANVKRDGD